MGRNPSEQYSFRLRNTPENNEAEALAILKKRLAAYGNDPNAMRKVIAHALISSEKRGAQPQTPQTKTEQELEKAKGIVNELLELLQKLRSGGFMLAQGATPNAEDNFAAVPESLYEDIDSLFN